MTVTQTSAYRYIGLSSDVKPTDAVTGARFIETDTTDEYEFTGAAWSRVGGTELVHVRKTLTFTGAAGAGLSGSAITLLTLTGLVKVERLTVYCTVDGVSAGGGTLAIGTADTIARFLAATLATNMDANKFVVSGTTALASAKDNLTAVSTAGTGVDISTNIIGTVATADITAGTITIDVWYRPISATGRLVGD